MYPPTGSPLGAVARSNATKGEYYPINAPVRPLSKIIAYGQCISGGGAMTAAAYAGVTFWFSNSRASGVWAPTSLDPHPGIQRYRKNTTLRTVPSAAGGFVDSALMQINLGMGGGVITEIGGLHTDATAVAGLSGGGTFRFISDDIPLMPASFFSNAFGSLIGATGEIDARDTITRRPCHMEGNSTCGIIVQFLQGAGKTGTTGDYIGWVEFVRA
jgi:hypothetical protein